MKSFRFSIDRGGTFTDVYAESSDGDQDVVKLLSEDPENYEDAPREGIRRILQKHSPTPISKQQVPAHSIEWIRMGTTVATNALLERKGEPVVLVITSGFKDVLRIGYQNRPDLFDLKISKPEQVYSHVIEAEERIRLVKPDEPGFGQAAVGVSGERYEVLHPLDLEQMEVQLSKSYKQGYRSVAVVLMHAYCFPDYEIEIGDIAEKIGFEQISLSHRVNSMVKLVARGDTASVDAYLTPHIMRYLGGFRTGFEQNLQGTQLLFMQSDGGLVNADQFKGSNAILSGPAGGVVGFAETSWKEFQKPVIGFDMGGTSTDVSRFGGTYERTFESETAGVRIQSPQVNIRTVAAGGGSRLFYKNGMLQVGPDSSGAHPGPVCYRKGGYLSITDANLILGRIQPEFFPKIFGASEKEPLDVESTRVAFHDLLEIVNHDLRKKDQKEMSLEELAEGFIEIANETMVRPIREISVLKGYDSKDHILSCFGGAGGQHACAVARQLGIQTVYIHRYAGILSAYGMSLANIVSEKMSAAACCLENSNYSFIRLKLDELQSQAELELRGQGFAREVISAERFLNLRFDGTDTAMMIKAEQLADFEIEFIKAYQREFGFHLENRDIVVDDIRVRATAVISSSEKLVPDTQACPISPLKPLAEVPLFFDGNWNQTPVFRLETMPPGSECIGPAFIIQGTSTIIVEPGDLAKVNHSGGLVIQIQDKETERSAGKEDPVQLAIFNHLFMSIAEQMGRILQRSAISTNIKERLDFSCAVFDSQGNLVANAPHVPVHLGAMGDAVKFQIRYWKNKLYPGDVLLSNHPAAGGSHLPDLTVITPVWHDEKVAFFVANRGHHAEIGGITPGSMPPFSKSLDDEGTRIKSFKLLNQGVYQEKELVKLFVTPSSPGSSGTRKIKDNLSDLRAQIASNHQGEKLLLELVQKYGVEVVTSYMKYMQKNAAESVRKMLQKLAVETSLDEQVILEAEDWLDEGTRIHLKLTIYRNTGTAVFDFSESDDEVEGNLNAPEAITRSALIYCLRCLVKDDIPLNQGCLEPVQLVLREGSILKPSENAAVVGGNVLTSQRITDVIFKAFGVAAASQGCMNNLTFGNEDFGYYETICGGAGAGDGWNGQSGVHTHMTNTRITDPEILERRYPVLLRTFELRKDSGGKGRFTGGDGVIRELEFLKPLNVSILSERRVYSPYGLDGGDDGKKGKNLLIRAAGTSHDLGGKNNVSVNPGDKFRIETPGGGGFGLTE